MNNSVSYQPQRTLFFFEESFDYKIEKQWMEQNWYRFLFSIPPYLLIIFQLQSFMKNRPRLELKNCLIIWNIGLAIFSLMGFLRCFPEFLYSFTEFGFKYSVCVPSFVEENKVSAFWYKMFGLSKVVELGDTLFIVLRKQKLIFLHWYHHTIVIIYAFYHGADYPAMFRWYVWINYAVHALMYSYYAMRAMKIRVPRLHAMSITVLQILQMVVAITVSVYAYFHRHECNVGVPTVIMTLFLYISFFVLFLNYFFKTYLKDEPTRKGKASGNVEDDGFDKTKGFERKRVNMVASDYVIESKGDAKDEKKVL